ncbi:hypothetical protein KSC_016980 [Ktedonobacter sp. SOSP1-52]|uniref:cupredoxin domain-containing protein n=1 Tax=Ktedonobacter sp. SOSP1-52 TaxID=2778366 RepID=UPI0019152921|nr:hypothetical protein [Ktedonobacter sp. SOSP1-52]GHO62806.1 hypothetical protein KSC_016980 [Ktedonobacter sp. SOSP1-52]
MKRFLAVFLLLTFALVLVGCGQTTSTSKGHTVNVTLSEFKIETSASTFQPGTAYQFSVTNTGKTDHEFMILPSSQGNMSGMSMDDMDKMALASIDTIHPGETKTLEYTFPSSTAGTQPEFACYLPGHYEAGMKQDIHIRQP